MHHYKHRNLPRSVLLTKDCVTPDVGGSKKAQGEIIHSNQTFYAHPRNQFDDSNQNPLNQPVTKGNDFKKPVRALRLMGRAFTKKLLAKRNSGVLAALP